MVVSAKRAGSRGRIVGAALGASVALRVGGAHAEPPAADGSESAPKPTAEAAAKESTTSPVSHAPSRDVTAMRSWFSGEHVESTAFQVVGLASVGGGAVLLSREGDAPQAAGATFAIIGAITTLSAVTYALPLGTTRAKIEKDFERDPEGARASETKRMRGIADRFVAYRWGEIVVAAAGVGLVAGGALADEGVPLGIGAALATEGGLALFLDSFGERRAATYLDKLESGAPIKAPPVGLAITPRGLAGAFRAEF